MLAGMGCVPLRPRTAPLLRDSQHEACFTTVLLVCLVGAWLGSLPLILAHFSVFRLRSLHPGHRGQITRRLRRASAQKRHLTRTFHWPKLTMRPRLALQFCGLGYLSHGRGFQSEGLRTLDGQTEENVGKTYIFKSSFKIFCFLCF